MRKLNLIAFMVLTVVAGGLAQAKQLRVTGKSEFFAVGKPGFIKIHGQGDGVTGELKLAGTKVTCDFTFPVTSLNTGIELRDKHLKQEFLETDKYPNAKLTLNDLILPANPEKEGFSQSKVPFTGVFTVHGVSKPMSGTIDLNTKDGVINGDAQFEVKISDYGFRKPEYLGLKVEDTVLVSAHIQAKD